MIRDFRWRNFFENQVHERRDVGRWLVERQGRKALFGGRKNVRKVFEVGLAAEFQNQLEGLFDNF